MMCNVHSVMVMVTCAGYGDVMVTVTVTVTCAGKRLCDDKLPRTGRVMQWVDVVEVSMTECKCDGVIIEDERVGRGRER